MSYSTIAKQSATLLGILVVLISVVAAGFAGSAAGSSHTVQTDSSHAPSSANITYTTYPDRIGGTYTATVTFQQDITQEGTASELMNAFEINQTIADLNYNTDPDEDNVTVNETTNQITFTVTEASPTPINSGTDFSTGNNNGLRYNASKGNNVLYADGAALSDFNVTLTNDIAPVIDREAPTDREATSTQLVVRHTHPGYLEVTFSEPVTIDAANLDSAFGFTGNAPTISGGELARQPSSYTVNLSFQNDVQPGDDLGKLTYNSGSNVVESAADDTAAQEPDIDLTVQNRVEKPPEIQQVVFDDVPENTDQDTTGEMLLYFDSNLNAEKAGGNDTSGLTFNSDSTDVSINVDGAITDDYNEQPDNVIAVEVSSASGAVASLVREGDTFGSNAELNVTPGAGLDISFNSTGGDIASTNVPAENISNEIAGNLSEVNRTSSDVEILGADVDEQNGYNVTVSGLSDGEHQVLDENISVTVAGSSTEVPASTVASEFRFDDEYTVSLPADGSVDSRIGEENVPINVTTANGTELQPNTNATVEIAHEARVTTAPTSGTFMISIPQPGELVADSDIGAINSYNATSGNMESYANMDATDRVHRGIFIDGNGTGNVYGITYKTESAYSGGTTAAMPQGWNLVGSNTKLTTTFPVTYDDDLRFGTSPAASSDDVRIVATNDIGSNNVSNTSTIPVAHDASGVKEYDVYYVYLYEPSTRPILESAYSSGD
jgi:hypothetical protein